MSKKKETGKVILVPEKSGAKTSKILCHLRKNRKKCILKKRISEQDQTKIQACDTGEMRMKEEKISNYVRLCEEWAERFLTMDQEDLRKRVPELKEEKDFLTIVHFGRKYGISLKDGRIRSLDGGREPDTTEMLNVYTLLGYAKENAFFMDKWVPFADLRNARPFAPAYKIGETDVFAATFSGHEKELREAFLKLGGKELPQGDVGYEIQAFACMPMRFFFWERDEEFEAQGNILFDYSATDFNHVESAVSIADVGIRRLAEIAGLPLGGKSFQMR